MSHALALMHGDLRDKCSLFWVTWGRLMARIHGTGSTPEASPFHSGISFFLSHSHKAIKETRRSTQPGCAWVIVRLDHSPRYSHKLTTRLHQNSIHSSYSLQERMLALCCQCLNQDSVHSTKDSQANLTKTDISKYVRQREQSRGTPIGSFL